MQISAKHVDPARFAMMDKRIDIDTHTQAEDFVDIQRHLEYPSPAQFLHWSSMVGECNRRLICRKALVSDWPLHERSNQTIISHQLDPLIRAYRNQKLYLWLRGNTIDISKVWYTSISLSIVLESPINRATCLSMTI